MKMPWFKLWAEFAFDPKIQSMDETLQRRYIMLLCLQCNGDLQQSTEEEIACALRLTLDEMTRTREILTRKGLLEDGWKIHGWDKRQSMTDKSAERVRRFRARQKAESVTPCNALRNVSVTPCNGIDIDKDIDIYNNPPISPLTPREEKLIEMVAPYTMTPKEAKTLCSTFTFTDEEVVAAMSHPNARNLKSPYLYLRNWLKRSAGKTQLSEFQKAVSGMFDQFAAEWPNRDCLGEARAVFLALFPETEDRQKGRDRARAINAHARAYLDRTEKQYVMRLAKWLRTTDFSLSPDAEQVPAFEVCGDA